MKKTIIIFIIGLLIIVTSFFLFSYVKAQGLGASVIQVFQGGTGASSFTAGECLKGNGTGAITTGACGTSGGGSGTVGTSTIPTVGNLAYWTSAGYPSLLSSVATTSLTVSSPLTLDNPISVIGGTAADISIDLSAYVPFTGGASALDLTGYSITGSDFNLPDGGAITWDSAGANQTVIMNGTSGQLKLQGSGFSAIMDASGITTADKTFTFPDKSLTFAGINDETFTGLTTLANASTTLLSATYATSTLYHGAGLQTCNASTGKLTWSGGVFSCATDNTASSTLLVDNNTWTGTNAFGAVTGISLDEIENPAASKTFTMAANDLIFNFTTPSNGLELNATGAFTDHMLHLHQSTGNVSAGTQGLHIEFADPDPTGLVIDMAGASTSPALKILSGTTNLTGGLATFGNASSSVFSTNSLEVIGNSVVTGGQLTLTGVTENGINPDGLTMWGGSYGGGLYARGDASGGDDFFDFVALNGIKLTTVSGGAYERMRIASTGNVGIGTTSPYARLSVDGRGVFNQDVRADYFTATSTTIASTLNYASTTALTASYASSTLMVAGNLTVGGAILNGIIDAGGAVSFEIPNAAAPTLNAIGKIAFDTTDNQFLIGTSTSNDPAVIPTRIKLFGGGISSTSPDFLSGGRIPTSQQLDGFIVDTIFCQADGGTSVVINLSNSGGTTDSTSVTCDADGQTVTNTANKNYAAGSINSLEIGTITGVVDYLTYSVWGYILRE